jgi:hypothetical protein
MTDVPKSIADNDQQLDKLMEALEKGSEVPTPEASAPTPGSPAPQAPVTDTPADSRPAPKLEDLQKQLDTAEQRYKTLQGMMTANDQRNREIIDGLKEQVEANKLAQVEAPLDVEALLTEEEMATFGEDGVKVLEKLAGAIAAKEISRASLEVEQKLEAMRQRVEQTEATATGNTTWDLVERINPGAKSINATDPGWFAFLDTADPVSGRLYRELGQAAASVNDIQRLSELIDVYRLGANLAKPQIPVKPNQAGPAPHVDGNRQPQVEKRIYTQDEVREFYANRALGRLDGITRGLNAEQLVALEADIDAAMEEGRVKL